MHSSPFSGSSYSQKQHPNHDIIRVCRACSRSDGHPCSACQEYLALNHRLTGSATTSIIGRLDDHDSQMQHEMRHEMLTRINNSHDPLTSHFPAEITSNVFRFSLPDDVGFRTLDHHYDHPYQYSNSDSGITRYGEKHIRSGPLLLGAVCRSWRHIAWSTPQIWTTIPISLNNLHVDLRRRAVIQSPGKLPRGHPAHLAVLQEWFDKAGRLPLSIQVSCPETFTKQECQWVVKNPFFALVNQNSYRWRELEIQGPAWVVGFFSGDRKSGAPSLSSLKLYLRQGEEFKFRIGKKAVAPRQVSVLSGSIRWLNINWGHTTEVTVEVALDECLQIMRLAPQLRKCTLSVGRNSGVFPLGLNGATLTHENLQFLHFLFDHSNDDRRSGGGVTQFLNNMSCPRLTELVFDKNIKLSWDKVIGFLCRSCCELTSLEIKMRCEYHIIAEVLWKIPSLRKLRITDAPLEFLKLLADTALVPLPSPMSSSDEWSILKNNALFLPNLESLNMWPYLDSIDDSGRFWHRVLDIFRPLTRARNAYFHYRPLNKLLINRFWCPEDGVLAIGIDRKACERISALARSGIVIEVKDWNGQYDLLKSATEYHQGKHNF